MKNKTKQLVKPASFDNLNLGAYEILSEKQLRLITGGNATETATLAATIRAANS